MNMLQKFPPQLHLHKLTQTLKIKVHTGITRHLFMYVCNPTMNSNFVTQVAMNRAGGNDNADAALALVLCVTRR